MLTSDASKDRHQDDDNVLTRNMAIAVLIAAYAISVIAKLLLQRGYGGPAILLDEALYRLFASIIAHFEPYRLCTYEFMCRQGETDPYYPPAYPAILSFAYMLPHWLVFAGIKGINVFVSSTMIFAVYAISRQFLSRHLAVAAGILSILTPFHFVYQSAAMSENLGLPLSLVPIIVAIDGRHAGSKRAILFGMILAACHLTKYLFLGMIPFIGLAFLYSQWAARQDLGTNARIRAVTWLCLFTAAGSAAVYAVWLAYALLSGGSLMVAFGFQSLMTGAMESAADKHLFGVYLTLHFFAVSLSVLVLLPLIVGATLLIPTQWRHLSQSLRVYAVLVTAIAVLYTVYISYYTWNSTYDLAALLGLPVRGPQDLVMTIGQRYLMALVPMLIPLAFVGLRLLFTARNRTRLVVVAISIATTLAIAVSGQKVMFDRTVWPFPLYITLTWPNGVDIAYGALGIPILNVAVVAAALACTIVVLACVAHWRRLCGKAIAIAALATLVSAGGVFTACGLVTARFAWSGPYRETVTGHGRALGNYLHDKNQDMLAIRVGFDAAIKAALAPVMGLDFNATQWSGILSFWADRQVVAVDMDKPLDPTRRIAYVLRPTQISGSEDFSYTVLGQTYALVPRQ